MKNVVRIAGMCLLGALLALVPARVAQARTIQLFLDGSPVNGEPAPVIRGGRTLVPVRLVAETLGAEVHWDPSDRSVTIGKEGSVRLVVDNRLVRYPGEPESWQVTDVSPVILGGRTFVPLRVVASALGIGADWDSASGAVRLSTAVHPGRFPFFDMRISTLEEGAVLTGATPLDVAGTVPAGTVEIRYYLGNRETHKVRIIGRSPAAGQAAFWMPQPFENGKHLLVAAAVGPDGKFLAGTVLPVEIGVSPGVRLEGVTPGQKVTGPVGIGVKAGFIPAAVRYEILRGDGTRILPEKSDPLVPMNWAPRMEDAGQAEIRALAYDGSGKEYRGDAVPVILAPDRSVRLSGIPSSGKIDGPVTLRTDRNFGISRATYVLRNQGGQETVLGTTDGAAFPWFPGPALRGTGTLMVRVTAADGSTHDSLPVPVEISGTPRLSLAGVGPRQVLTSSVALGVRSNLGLSRVRFVRINPRTGDRTVLGETGNAAATLTVNPLSWGGGSWRLVAQGTYDGGKTISSEEISLTVFTGKLYSARPVIAKDRFLEYAAAMAVESRKKTGMSAALQTAQAILETGWGQSVPVDKYTGLFSRNLFGIKGTGPAGSVVSNTWEEYNGTAFRVDASFRAYHSVQQSWDDHKRLLLTGARYAPYREVMHDGVQGAWALRRAGYATDSRYPVKLIGLMEQYDLFRLDLADL